MASDLLADARFSRVILESVCQYLDDKVAAELSHTTPWVVKLADTLTSGVPKPNSVAPFVDLPLVRMPGGNRCFYCAPSTIGHNTVAVLAIKGMEPCAHDFETLVRDLDRACYSPHNVAEHFVFVEHKIPACVGFAEAMKEAEQASVIQAAHLEVYGELAQLPVPLRVFRHSEATVNAVRRLLRETLQKAAFDAISPLLDAGLGVYVYHYPTPPVRARDIEHVVQGLPFRERLLAVIRMVGDPEAIVKRWVRGVVRLLYLGYLPGTLAALRSGMCCQPQNACIDGGFVDLDSVTNLGDLRTDTAVQAALQLSVDQLIDSVRTLIAGSADPTRPEGLEVRVDLHAIRQYVFGLIEVALKTEARLGLVLDRRIENYFSAPRTLDQLIGRLGPYYSPPSRLGTVPDTYADVAEVFLRSVRRTN